jgi:predicted phage terminase large subunit-like protein
VTNLQIIKKLQKIVKKNPSEFQAVSDLFEMLRIYESENYDKSHGFNKDLRVITAQQAKNSKLGIGKNTDFYYLHKKTLLFDAKDEFDAFLQYVEFDRDPDKKFYIPRRKIIKPIVDSLQEIEDDKIDLLAISQPPGTGKTTVGIFFLSWIMGKYPNMPNLASAHADKLTRSFYDGVLTIITDPEYLWADVFPGVQVQSTNSKDETINLDKPKRFKSLTCRSIDGSLTGATRCEKILYADDLVSGIEEALSIDRLDSLWNKYTNDLKSRKKQGCKEIHIATRWSVHDPIGRLQKQYGNDPRAKFIAFPALDENDESNFNYKYGVGFDTKYFHDMRDNLDDVSWKCLYMNEPIEREGLLYSEEDLRRYYELPEGEPDAIIAVCDTAEGGGDDTFLPVAYVYGNDYYIEDCVCDNSLPEITDALCAEILLKHRVKQCQFESNSAGGRTADKVQEKVKEKGGITHITKKRTTSNKETKIIVNSTFVKERFVFKDKSQYRSNSSYAKMMRLLCSYTMMGKNKHDDVPDGLAQLAEYIQSLKGREVEVIKRPF